MRFGIGADVHSNYFALEAVVAAMEAQGIEHKSIVLLGDLVGYNAQPEKCVKNVMDAGIVCVDGNHDIRVLKDMQVPPSSELQRAAMDEVDNWNPYAVEAIHHNERRLSDESLSFLSSRPLDYRFNHSVGVHAGLYLDFAFYFARERQKDRLAKRVSGTFEAMDDWAKVPQHEDLNICFIGHSHTPGFVREGDPVFHKAEDGTELDVGDRTRKFIIDVGSVGQPRDGNPRSSWVDYDDRGTVRFKRTGYNVHRMARENREAGLPEYLSERLFVGL